MRSFATSRDHLLAELERVDFLLQAHVARARHLNAADDRFQGLCITEQEVDGLLARQAGLPSWAAAEDPPDGPRDQPNGGEAALPSARPRERLAELSRLVEAEARAAASRGVRSRLNDLTELFALEALDRDALLVCVAPEVDLRYERLFAYLQDDVTKRRPSVDLVLNLLVSSLDEKLTALERFRPEAPLIDHELVTLFDDPHHHTPPLLGKFVKVDDRVVSYLLDGDGMDARVRAFARISEPKSPLAELSLPADVRTRLASLASSEEVRSKGLLLYLQGPKGSGRRLAAEGMSTAMGRKLVTVDVGAMLKGDAERVERVGGDVARAVREAALQGAALFLEGFDELLSDDRDASREAILRSLQRWPLVACLSGEVPWVPATDERAIAERLCLFAPDARDRLALWRTSLDGRSSELDETELTALASKFRLQPGQIRGASAAAVNLARSRDPGGRRLTVADLEEASRLQSTRGLSKLARKIEPRYTWDDIVLPQDRVDLLREICNQVRYRARVYGDWGFDRRLSLGKGLNALFSGPSGTGKTMAAEILAGELGLELYKIDLAVVVSKYIGETEKNLSKIFVEAETANAILFFDEADALFGKRSEVKDAHDRYANIEIAYLLQRMEEYEGVVILATNIRKNMDEAFVRRLHFGVEFPFPDEADRRRIWHGIWPSDTPRGPTVDLETMAARFEISGGSIRNIALAAAFLAAADGGRVDMTHLLRATRREYQKMGKVIDHGDLVKEAALMLQER
jgi:hypothetical protein